MGSNGPFVLLTRHPLMKLILKYGAIAKYSKTWFQFTEWAGLLPKDPKSVYILLAASCKTRFIEHPRLGTARRWSFSLCFAAAAPRDVRKHFSDAEVFKKLEELYPTKGRATLDEAGHARLRPLPMYRGFRSLCSSNGGGLGILTQI